MKKLKIKNIKKLENKRSVKDLTVYGNHNFFVGNSEILTHNCDYLSVNAQAALRNLIEASSIDTRFILTCNYIEKVIPALKSRLIPYELFPPSKKDVGLHVINILSKEKIGIEPEDLLFIVNSFYPDVRKIINTLQFYVDNDKHAIFINKNIIEDSDYKLKILKTFSNEKLSEGNMFIEIRQILADSKSKDYDMMFNFLYDNLDNITNQNSKKALIIIELAEGQYKCRMGVDFEIAFMASTLKIIEILKSN